MAEFSFEKDSHRNVATITNGVDYQFVNCREAGRDISHWDKVDTQAERRRRRHSSGGADRETWTRKVEYFFAGLGYAVGLGNIWRFPYLCYRNGGGAFLIPYVICLVAAGFPMMFLEMSFGQFASLGPITIWRICPLFKGIGWAILMVLLLVNTYYSVLIAYGLYYLFASITNDLPWASCGHEWNTENCVQSKYAMLANSTNVSSSLLKTPTEEYFENHLLNMTSGIHEMGGMQWPLIICSGVSWFTCFMCLFKGIKSMGKAVIFTTIFSYVILTVLLIRGVTLPGAIDGIIFYLKPDFKKLAHLQVWGEASAQVFASLSLGGGGWITLSSYNKDAVLVGAGNALTSFYAGFVIFSVLGYMAYVKGVPVDRVTAQGPGLAFVAYPEGLALIPGAPFWAICFFFMMFSVGLDSLFGQVETIAAGIIDEWPEYLRPRRKMLTAALCIFMFLLGIPLISQGGIYMVTLMDWYTLLFSFTIISLMELTVIIYIYGYKHFANDIFMMLGFRPNKYYIVTWYGVCPVTLVCVIIFLAVSYQPPQYGTYFFPAWANSIGWALALVPVSLIAWVALVQFLRAIGTCSRLRGLFTDREVRLSIWRSVISPSLEWGPALPEDRRKYSSTSERKAHPSGDTLGDDDVFSGGAAELVDFKPLSEDSNRLVHFEDETHHRKESKGSQKDEEAKEEVKEELLKADEKA
ncbi:hypothetical protein CAPTEDRAFT_191230 [Capitella teleta]|uniref:Transporter n=1 Tax=Capitella teleta TaxID=283909 RepID=R7TFV2_CAPTE|nr:hypothetical protein CAPTEDRAFT_191230 [Capitella teleta]|eukprot:ELT92352.1 hypothetical protein CAPTEDRAFT_191230 [Capitella teleta]